LNKDEDYEHVTMIYFDKSNTQELKIKKVTFLFLYSTTHVGNTKEIKALKNTLNY